MRVSTRHNDALHTLLRHEWVSARDVPLSLAVPRDRRVRDLARSTLDDPGKVHSVEAWAGRGAGQPQDCRENIHFGNRHAAIEMVCGTPEFYTLFPCWQRARKSRRLPWNWATGHPARLATCSDRCSVKAPARFSGNSRLVDRPGSAHWALAQAEHRSTHLASNDPHPIIEVGRGAVDILIALGEGDQDVLAGPDHRSPCRPPQKS